MNSLYILTTFFLTTLFNLSNSACDETACAGIDFCCQVDEVDGVNVVSTERSYLAYPEALDIASLTVDYMLSRLEDRYVEPLNTHVVYVYHGDPSLSTGVGLSPNKSSQYDYPSDIYGLTVDTFDGRSFDSVYGYGGIEDVSNPTSILDCNLLSYCDADIYFSESILHHEFGHTIRNIGLYFGNRPLYNYLDINVYNDYIRNVNGANTSYCGSNSDELFACAIQVWFAGISRTDTGPGIYNIGLLERNLPSLYGAFMAIFGEPVEKIVFDRNDVIGLPNYPDYLFYDNFINEYGSNTLRNHWNTIKLITDATPAPTEESSDE